MLTTLLLVPIVCAIALLLGKGDRTLTKISAIVQIAITLLICFGYDTAKSGYQFVHELEPFVPSLDLKYSVGVDGLSVVMLLLSSLVFQLDFGMYICHSKGINLGIIIIVIYIIYRIELIIFIAFVSEQNLNYEEK